MKTLRPLLITSFLLLLAQTSFAHGLIEKIQCHSKGGNEIHFYGHESEEISKSSDLEYELYFFTFNPKTGLRDLGIGRFGLEDEVVDGQVIEKISIDFGAKGQAVLRIPENYDIDQRPGTGQLSLNNPNMSANMDCVATYE